MDPTTLRRVTAEQFKQLPKEEASDVIVCKAGAAKVEKADSEGDRVLRWTISTADIDRDGDTIKVAGWNLENFEKGGSVLWAHDATQLPIAKPLETFKTRKALKSVAQFTAADENPFGHMVYRLAKEGYVRSASVGFRPTKFKEADRDGGMFPMDFLEQELLEWSVVPVPANPSALMDAKSKGIELGPMREWAEKVLDGEQVGLLWVPRNVAEQIWNDPAIKQRSLFPVKAEEPEESDSQDTAEEGPETKPTAQPETMEPETTAPTAEPVTEPEEPEAEEAPEDDGLIEVAEMTEDGPRLLPEIEEAIREGVQELLYQQDRRSAGRLD